MSDTMCAGKIIVCTCDSVYVGEGAMRMSGGAVEDRREPIARDGLPLSSQESHV